MLPSLPVASCKEVDNEEIVLSPDPPCQGCSQPEHGIVALAVDVHAARTYKQGLVEKTEQEPRFTTTGRPEYEHMCCDDVLREIYAAPVNYIIAKEEHSISCLPFNIPLIDRRAKPVCFLLVTRIQPEKWGHQEKDIGKINQPKKWSRNYSETDKGKYVPRIYREKVCYPIAQRPRIPME